MVPAPELKVGDVVLVELGIRYRRRRGHRGIASVNEAAITGIRAGHSRSAATAQR
jgi:high-affinity K+ transport system ATPase subunit B